MTGKAQTANQMTAALLIGIPRRFPNSICWRNNTGRGVGWSSIKAAVACLKRRDVDGALKHLTRPIAFGLVGSADVIVVMGPGGTFVGCEVKAEGDSQGPEQVAFEIRIKALGGIYLLVENVEESLLELERLCRVNGA